MVNGRTGRFRKQHLAAALYLVLLLGMVACTFARHSRRGGGEEGTREEDQRSGGSRRSRRSSRNGGTPAGPAVQADGARSRGRRNSTREPREKSSPPSPPPSWMGPLLERVELYAPKLERLNRTTSCIRRTSHGHIQEHDVHENQVEEVGLVLVMTDLSAAEQLNSFGCQSGKLGYYIFLRPGVSHELVSEELSQLSACIKHIQSGLSGTVMDHVPAPQVTTEYLHYISHRYFALPDTLVFAELPADFPGLPAAVADAFTGVWAYKPFEHHREPIQLRECKLQAPSCNVTQFQQEVVSLFKRYTCDGTTCERVAEKLESVERYQVDKEHSCMLPHVHRSFITTAKRVRQVARVEYVWASLWLQSWQEGARGRLFDGLSARLWPLLLGCPELVHFGEAGGFSGCLEEMAQRGGPRTEGKGNPDQAIFRKDEVSLPIPSDLLQAKTRAQYSSLKWLRNRADRKITFVVTCGETPPGGMSKLSMYLGALLASALVNHPYAQLVVLAKQELAGELQKKLNPEKFAHRIQVVVLRPRNHDPWYGGNSGDGGIERDSWAYAHWFQLVQQWLETLPISGRGASAGEYGHLVFVPANTVVTGDLWGLFDRPFSLGFPAAGGGTLLPEGLMLVHQERIWQAELTLRSLSAALQQNEAETFIAAVHKTLLSCPQTDRALISGKGDTVMCSGLGSVDAVAVTSAVRLFSCKIWDGRPSRSEPPRAWKGNCDTKEGNEWSRSLFRQVVPASTSNAWKLQREAAEAAGKVEGIEKDEL